MTAETKKTKLDLMGDLRQNFNMPLQFEGEQYKMQVAYKHETRKDWNRKELEITIPYVCMPPAGYIGLRAQFIKYADGSHYTLVGDGHDYCHNPEVQKFFEEFVQPVLEANLPTYMKKLIQFKANK